MLSGRSPPCAAAAGSPCSAWGRAKDIYGYEVFRRWMLEHTELYVDIFIKIQSMASSFNIIGYAILYTMCYILYTIYSVLYTIYYIMYILYTILYHTALNFDMQSYTIIYYTANLPTNIVDFRGFDSNII